MSAVLKTPAEISGALLDFWFRDHGRPSWFAVSAAFDDDLRQRFSAAFAQVVSADRDALLATPQTALASVLLLDQFPRNVFRKTPQAFATDAAALDLANAAVARGLDQQLASIDEKLFLYLPFEHSENLADQHRAVELISRLADAEYTRFAQAHRDVIARFGRFPHRNAILGRQSTAEELDFLKQPGSTF
jgi:uncharacterized protein (DUF924 family)